MAPPLPDHGWQSLSTCLQDRSTSIPLLLFSRDLRREEMSPVFTVPSGTTDPIWASSPLLAGSVLCGLDCERVLSPAGAVATSTL